MDFGFFVEDAQEKLRQRGITDYILEIRGRTVTAFSPPEPAADRPMSPEEWAEVFKAAGKRALYGATANPLITALFTMHDQCLVIAERRKAGG
jgi:hypothetical protein